MAYISEEDKKALSALRAKGAKKGSIFKNVGLVIGLFGVVALIAVFVLFGLDFIEDGLLVALFMILAAVFVVALVLYGYGKSFRSTYQRKAFAFLEEKRGRALFGDIVYDPDRAIAQQVIDYAGFFDVPSRYFGSLYMAGRYEGIPFEKGHYVLQRKQESKNGTHYVTYAEGTFYRFALGRDLGGLVRIVEKKEKNGTIDPGELSLVQTESIAFDEKFAVLSDDPTRALYVLTPAVMEKIMDLEKHFSGLFDVAFIGIGENGHIAFNDPHEARFDDPETVKITTLDEQCRQQQVNDGEFADISLVPRQAMTLTIPTLMSCRCVVGIVPLARKAKAVHDTLYGPITEQCPASILRTHDDATLFLDLGAASALRI